MRSEATLAPDLRDRAWEITRWLLLAPACFAAWFSILWIGLFVYSGIEQYLCPPGYWMLAKCVESNTMLTLLVVVSIFAAFSALTVEAVAISVAPRAKRIVLWSTFTFGSVAALALTGFSWQFAPLLPCLSAIGAGAIGGMVMQNLTGVGLWQSGSKNYCSSPVDNEKCAGP